MLRPSDITDFTPGFFEPGGVYRSPPDRGDRTSGLHTARYLPVKNETGTIPGGRFRYLLPGGLPVPKTGTRPIWASRSKHPLNGSTSSIIILLCIQPSFSIVTASLSKTGRIMFVPGKMSPSSHRLSLALSRVRSSPYKVIIVTNQSAVGRGILSYQEAEAINHRLIAELERAGCRIDGIIHVPTRS